jgi:hypothetical protein
MALILFYFAKLDVVEDNPFQVLKLLLSRCVFSDKGNNYRQVPLDFVALFKTNGRKAE